MCGVYEYTSVNIMPEVKRNILNFGYGINFKYEGMLSHSFDRFYVITQFVLPKNKDLKFTTIQFDSSCKYLDSGIDRSKYSSDFVSNLSTYCKKIIPSVDFYKKQIEYYNHTAYEILTNKISLIFPAFPKERRQKRGIITLIITGFIVLAYESISSFLQHKRHKVLHKAVMAMENKVVSATKVSIWNIQWLCMIFIIWTLWNN